MMIPNMRGKSWAMLHSLFQRFLPTVVPPSERRLVCDESILTAREIDLMWQSFQAAHKIHIVGLHEQIAEMKEQLDMFDAREYDRQQSE